MCQHDISEILKNEIINVHLLMFSFRILIIIVTMNVFSCTQPKTEMAFYRAVFFLLNMF